MKIYQKGPFLSKSAKIYKDWKYNKLYFNYNKDFLG